MELNQTEDSICPVRIWLLNSSDVKGITYYRVAGRFVQNGQTWHVDRRYSEFLMLRDTLVKFFTHAMETCPGCLNYLHSIKHFDFPKKHIFLSKNQMVINYRVKALRAFIGLLASWSFSSSPKCPTCGGFAFDILRNFVLEGAEAESDSNMGFIRDALVVSTFMNNERASTKRQSLDRRNSHTGVSTASINQKRSLQRHISAPDNQTARETFSDCSDHDTTGATKSSINQQPEEPALFNGGKFLLYRDGLERPQNSNPKPSILKNKKDMQPHRDVRYDRTQNESYISLAGSDISMEHVEKATDSRHSRGSQKEYMPDFSHLATRPQESPHRRSYQQNRQRDDNESLISLAGSNADGPSSDEMPDFSHDYKQQHEKHLAAYLKQSPPRHSSHNQNQYGQYRERYQFRPSHERAPASEYSDEDEIDVTGLTVSSPKIPRQNKDLWQPWELARAS